VILAGEPPCVPLSALRRDPPPRVRVLPPMRHTAATRSVHRAMIRNLAVALWEATGSVAEVARALRRQECYARELLAEAGAKPPRRRCSPAPRGKR
jgi:hypothetical protein